MFNIGNQTTIVDIEKTKCSIGHIQQCISDTNKHENPIYSYAGPRVQKGAMLLHTCNGDFVIVFDVKNGWARRVKFF